MWLAVHKDNAHFACLSDMDYDSLLREELGQETVGLHRAAARPEPGPGRLLLHALASVAVVQQAVAGLRPYAPTARSCLGEGTDQAQQSIRTFFNISQPAKRYVKTSLSILNMGFMRGLSPYYMSGTPAINEYIHGLIASDPGCARTASPSCARRPRWAFATTTTKPPSRWTRRTRRCSRRFGATIR